MFGDFCKNVEHSNIKSRDYFTGTGTAENLFHDKTRATQQDEESKKTEKSK
jgi:hypothetical protein